jgi:hypothetical protein
LNLAAIYLSRVGVVGSVFAAALTQVLRVVMPIAVAAQNINVGPCRVGGVCRHASGDGAHRPFAAQRDDGALCPSRSSRSNGEEQIFTRPKQVLWTRFEIVLEGPNTFEKWISSLFFISFCSFSLLLIKGRKLYCLCSTGVVFGVDFC